VLKLLIALVFIAAGAGLGWFAMNNGEMCFDCGQKADSSSISPNGLQSILVEDLKTAEKAKELPAMWTHVKEVKYLYHSKNVQKILNNSPIVPINKNGDKRLLVEFFDEPGSADIAMVRYNLIDLKSGNTVGEINRRVKLPKPLPVKAAVPVVKK
jgi:hypothetical protein